MASMADNESQLWELSTRSEAVYLDAVTDDASSGFIARVCRFPEEQLAWVWLHVFHHGHVHSYTSHEVRCDSDPVDESGSPVSYTAGDFDFSRSGDRFSPSEVSVSVSAALHSGPSSPHGEGVLPCELRAMFEPVHAGVQTLAGRSEVLGITRAVMILGDARIELEAHGQFHEQVQREPRFTRPFTYATLRGADAGCIFVRGVRGASGTLTLGGTAHPVQSIAIEPPGTVRRFACRLEDGQTVTGQAIATYQYDLPIFHMLRTGSLVTAELGGKRLSGCINDLAFGDLEFDHF